MTKKLLVGVALVAAVGVVYHFATLPPAPPAVPAVTELPVPKVPALTAYDMPTGNVPVLNEEFRSTYRSVSIQQVIDAKLDTGIYKGTPYWKQREKWFNENFYATLAAKKVWPESKGPDTHQRGDPVTWTYEPIPQYVRQPG